MQERFVGQDAGELKAVILAAGEGSRLRPLTDEIPKCMLALNGAPIIDYQIRALKHVGIREQNIFVIGGYRYAALTKFLSDRFAVNLIENAAYNRMNNIYTFYMIAEIAEIALDDSFVLFNSDTVFDPTILRQTIRDCRDEKNYLVVDRTKKLGDEEMKVCVTDGYVSHISKKIDPAEAAGEYIGIAKFYRHALDPLFERIRALLAAGKGNLWYEDAFNLELKRLELIPHDTLGSAWCEIDTPEDYRRAQGMGIAFDV